MDNIRRKANNEMQDSSAIIVKSLNISGMQNAEKFISELFRKVGKHKLVKVQLDGSTLTMYFDGKEIESCNNIVKQGSKKKYQTMSAFMKSKLPLCNGQCLLGTFQTNTHFFLFFN